MYRIKLPSGEIKLKSCKWVEENEGKYSILISSRWISRRAFMSSDGSDSESHIECNTEREEDSISDLGENPHNTNPEMSETPINVLTSFIPTFNSSSEEVFSFIDACNDAIGLATTSQKEILFKFIKTRIRGNATTILMNKEIKDWESLKKELYGVFREPHSSLQLHRELISIKQNRNESVTLYTQRVETLQRRLMQSKLHDVKEEDSKGQMDYIKDEALTVFINGLQEKLGAYVVTQKP